MRFLSALTIAAALALGACVADLGSPQPVGAASTVSDGRYAAFVRRFSAARSLDVDEELTEQATRVLERIRAVVIADYPEAASWPWRVHVPIYGGIFPESFGRARIVLSTGYFDRVQPSDDFVAMAIGHEIAHDLLRHTDEAEQEIGRGAYLAAATWRRYEVEADVLGMKIAVKAGYRPDAAVAQLRKIQAHEPYDPSNPFWARWPSYDERIRALQSELAKLP